MLCHRKAADRSIVTVCRLQAGQCSADATPGPITRSNELVVQNFDLVVCVSLSVAAYESRAQDKVLAMT